MIGWLRRLFRRKPKECIYCQRDHDLFEFKRLDEQLTRRLADQIAQEIDDQILADLRDRKPR